MPTLQGMKRIIVAAAFAAAALAAPVAVSLAAPSGTPLAQCAAGEDNDLFTDNCVPQLAPNVPGGNYPTPAPVEPSFQGEITESTPGDADSIPEVDGVPCTGGDAGQCIGLEEDAVPPIVPHSSLSSSP